MKKLAFLLCLTTSIAVSQTNISISNSVVTSNVKHIGINLGGWAPYGSQSFAKRIFINSPPAFQNSIVASTVPCDQAATTTTCQTGEYQAYTSGWWGSYVTSVYVMTGTAEGCTATVTNYVPNTFTFTALTGNSPITGQACSTFSTTSGAGGGNPYIYVVKTITAANSGTSYQPAYNWQTYTYGSSPTFTNSSDAPASPDSVSTYQSSLELVTTGSDTAGLKTLADQSTSQVASRNFINLNNSYHAAFSAKVISGSASVVYRVKRGTNVLYTKTFTVTSTSWTTYTDTAAIHETSPNGQLEFDIEVTGPTDVRITNIDFSEPTTASNPTVFTDGAVAALKDYAPGIIRMWDDNTGQTSSLDNMLKDAYARQPVNYKSGLGYPGYYNTISYSIPDFLLLCQTVGAEAWIVVPVTFTPTDAKNLVDYLSGSSSTAYGAKRIAQGYTTPWTTTLSHIYLELGNEQWNNSFTGGDTAYNPAGYGQHADELFAAMKSQPSYVANVTSLVLGMQFENATYVQPITSLCTHNDMVDMGPYSMDQITNFSDPQLAQTVLAEPQLFFTPVGSANCMENYNYSSYSQTATACPTEAYYNNGSGLAHQYGGGIFSMFASALANSAHSVPIAFYEYGMNGAGSEPGSPTQANLDLVMPSLLAGLNMADTSLTGMYNGVTVENPFQFGQDYEGGNPYASPSVPHELLWGMIEDAGGPTNGRRPTFWANKLINAVISTGGSALQVTQTSGPTLTIGTPSATTPYANQGAINSIAANNIQQIRSFAFSGSSGYGLVMLNESPNNQAVTFSGTNVPTGTVAIATLAASSIYSNNETTTTTVVPAYSSASSPTSYTLPAYSEVTMSWGSSGGGGSTSAQTYYIDNVSGNDSNLGTSSNSPWATLGHLTSQTLAAGSSILLKSGDIFREQLLVTNSGSSGNLISYSSYGVGNNPIVSGSNYSTSWISAGTNQWSISQSSFVTPVFSGSLGVLVASQSAVTTAGTFFWNSSNNTLYVYSSGNPSTTVEVPTRNYAINLNAQSYIAISKITAQEAGIVGIWCQTATAANCSNNTITNNIVNLNTSNGINFLGTNSGQRISNNSITNNNTSYNGSSGIKIGGYWAAFTVNNNTANYNCTISTSSGFDNLFCGGIYLFGQGLTTDSTYGNFDASEGVGTIVNTNVTTFNGLNQTGNLSFGSGLWLDTVNATSKYNTSYNNNSSQFYLEKDNNTTFEWNLAYNCGSISNTGCLTVAAGQGYNSTNVLVANNTLVGGFSGLTFSIETNGNTGLIEGTTFENNIVSTTGYAVYGLTGYNNGTTSISNSLTHNSFGANYTNMFYNNGTAYSSYSAFEAVVGTTNSMQQNPLFVNASSNNYNLQSGSPARNAGVTISGYTPPCTTYPDLGSLQYSCSANIITASATYVKPGQSITLTSQNPGTFAISGPGTLTTLTSTTATYTAPSSVLASTSRYGCPVFPNDTIFNTPINNLPTNSNQSSWLAALGSYPLKFATYTWGQSYATAATPTRNLKTYYFSNTGNFPTPTIPYLFSEGGSYSSSRAFSGGFDAHTQVTSVPDCTFYDTYGDAKPLGSSFTYTCADSSNGCNAQSLATYTSVSYANFNTKNYGTTAGGFPLALTITASEIINNTINHPSLITLGVGQFQYNTSIWPAAATAGGCAGTAQTAGSTNCNTAGPMGMHFRLNSSVSPTTVCSSGTDLPSVYCRELVVHDQTYGMFFIDTGTPLTMYLAPDTTENPNIVAAVNKYLAGSLTTSNLQIVDSTSLVSSNNSYEICAYNATCLGSVQSYVTTSANQVLITNGTASLTIPIWGEAIGFPTLPQQTISAQTGSYSVTLPMAVIPALSNQSINWSLVSGGGSVSGNTYTPPANNTTYTNAVLKATSVGDSNLSTNLYINLLPPTTVRVDVGSSSNITDVSGNNWIADIGSGGGTVQNTSDYPHWNQTSPTSTVVYETNSYTYGNDWLMNLMLPNGNYKVHLLFGINSNSHCNNGCTTFPGLSNYDQYTYGPVAISTNGITQYHGDLYYNANYLFQRPVDVYVPATVTDNILRINVASMGSDTSPTFGPSPVPIAQLKLNMVAGVEILTDSVSPHWVIDPGVTSTGIAPSLLTAGSVTAPLYIQDWHTGMTVATWSILSAPLGVTINSTTGAVTVANGTYFTGQPIVVQATNGTYTATYTFYTKGNQILH